MLMALMVGKYCSVNSQILRLMQYLTMFGILKTQFCMWEAFQVLKLNKHSVYCTSNLPN